MEELLYNWGVDELTTNSRKGDERIEYQPDAFLTVTNAPQYFTALTAQKGRTLMSTTTNSSAGSLLATPVTASSVTSAQQTATPVFKLPTIGNLPIGHYESEIVDVADAVQNGQVVGVDCFHQLTDSSGSTYHMRFRYYAPHEVDALVKAVASYGLSGSLGNLLQGLQESVDVAPKAPPSNYMQIAHRTLQAPAQTTTSSSPPTVAPVPGSSTTESPLPKRKGGLATRPKTGTKPRSQASMAASLLDDDDEWDDMLDEDED